MPVKEKRQRERENFHRLSIGLIVHLLQRVHRVVGAVPRVMRHLMTPPPIDKARRRQIAMHRRRQPKQGEQQGE